MDIRPSRTFSIALLALASTALADSTAPRGWFLEANALDVDSSGEQDSFEDETGRDAIAGVGLGVWLSPQWRLNLLYERVDFDLESAGVGVSFRF